MKLKDFIKNIVDLSNESPEILEMDVVYSIDDEGNAFRSVHNFPTIGLVDDGDFISWQELTDNKSTDKPNCVCIN